MFSCNPSSQKDWGIQINATYSYKNNGYDCSQSLYIEEENEKFVWVYQTDDSSKMNEFSFQCLQSLSDLSKSYCKNDFKFYDVNNIEIAFIKNQDVDSENYSFIGNSTIYIDYSEGVPELKSIIQSKHFMITVCSVHWISE